MRSARRWSWLVTDTVASMTSIATRLFSRAAGTGKAAEAAEGFACGVDRELAKTFGPELAADAGVLEAAELAGVLGPRGHEGGGVDGAALCASGESTHRHVKS